MFRARPSRAVVAVMLFAIVTLGSTAAQAAEWYVESQVQTQTSYDTNVRLSPTDKIDTAAGMVSPEVRIGRRTEALDLSLLGRADLNGYLDPSSLSSVDGKLRFTGNYTTPRDKLGLETGVNHDTTLTTEVTDTGDLTEAARVTTVDVVPSWSHALSEIDTIDVAAGYVNTSYDTDSLTDYVFYSGQVGWSRRVTEIDTLQTVAYTGRFEAEDSGDTTADIVGLLFGWSRQFSEQVSARLAVGPEYVISRFDEAGGRETDRQLGYRIDGVLAYQMDELTRLDLSGSRKTEPSGSGETVTRNQLQVALIHRVDPLFTVRLDATVLQNRDTGSNSGNSDRFYYAIQPRAIWRLDQDTDLAASYRFRSQDFSDNRDTASSHAVFLTLTHRLPRWSWTD